MGGGAAWALGRISNSESIGTPAAGDGGRAIKAVVRGTGARISDSKVTESTVTLS
jgi:hypothetical protein